MNGKLYGTKSSNEILPAKAVQDDVEIFPSDSPHLIYFRG